MATITLQDVLSMGISYNEYRNAAMSGHIIVVRRGDRNFPTLIDTNSPYLLRRDRLNQNNRATQ